MKRPPPVEDTPRVLAVAVAFFGVLALRLHLEGAFERLPASSLAAMAAFAAACIALTLWRDRGLRAWLGGRFEWRAPRLRGTRARPSSAPATSPGATPAAT